MGRQFGLIAVLTLMVLVIEFTPGCHGRSLSSKHHSGHHNHDDHSPPPPYGSGDHSPPPPSQDESDDSADRGYGQPYPPPPPPPSQDVSDFLNDLLNGHSEGSEGSDETSEKSFAQMKTLLTSLRSRLAKLSSHPPPPPHDISDGVSHPPPHPDFSHLLDSEDSEDSDDSAEKSSINSRQGDSSGSDVEAIRDLALQIAQHIGLVDDQGIHWDAMLALKEEQVDDVIKAVSEFVGKHFADHKGKVDWKAIAQALFGDGGLISGEYNSVSSEETD